MKYWLIGCGILLLIVIVLGVFTVHYFVTHFQEMKQEFEEVAAEYHELEAAYPFKKPTDNIVTTVQMGRFVRCRKELAYGVQEMLDRFEDEETSGLDKLGMLFNMFPAIGKHHVNALGDVQMSPIEYHWLLNQVLLMLRYAESPKAPEGLKDLRNAYNLLPSEGHPGAGMGGVDWNYGDPDNDPKKLIPQVDPEQILIPEQSIQAMLDHGEGLKETMFLFLHFDPIFINAYLEIRKEARKGAFEEMDPGRVTPESEEEEE